MANVKRSSTLSGRNVAVLEHFYAADWSLYDRFLGFSAEILRVSLAGIGVSGFLVALLADNGQIFARALGSGVFQGAILMALGFLALAAVLALAHRFFASDGMYHHLVAIKLLIVLAEEKERTAASEAKDHEDHGFEAIQRRIGREEGDRNRKLKLSEIFLKISGFFLAFGAIALGLAFAVILTLR